MLKGMTGTGFCKFLVATSALSVGAALAAPAHAEEAAAVRQFNVPAQPLGKALLELGRQAGISISVPSEATNGKTSHAVSGRMTTGQALAQLLQGTGLTFQFVNESAVRVVGSAASDGASVLAQGEAQDALSPSGSEAGEIVVTGTNIRGGAPRSAPLQTYSRRQIEATGASTVEQFMRTVPQNFGSGRNQETFNIPGAGSDVSQSGAAVNLRGLGNRATLVLVNGRRLAPAGFGEGVDISLLPLSAIDRIDILTDGASAIYGSDAVGGVVNYVLRDDFDGAETRLRAGLATDGGAEEFEASQLVGKTWKSGHALVAYDYRDVGSVKAGDRSFTIDLPKQTTILPAERRHNLLMTLGQDLSERLSLDLSGMYARRKTKRAFLPFAAAVPTISSSRATTTTLNGSGSLKYRLGSSWEARLVGNYARTREHESIEGQRDTHRRNGVAEGSLLLSGDLVTLPAGPVRVAAGATIRRETLRSEGVVSGTSAAVHLRRTVKALYGEFLVPILGPDQNVPGVHRLEVNVAGRYEHYSDLGSTSNPKVGLAWSPVRELTLRSTYSTSFRAPLLTELGGRYSAFYFPPTLPGYLDPGTTGFPLVLLGSSPDIDPERSKTFTVGADFRPAAETGPRFSVNYFRTSYRGRIAIPSPSTNVVGNPAFESIIIRNPTAAFTSALVAGASLVQDFSNPDFTPGGRVPSDVTIIIDDRTANSAETRIAGLDFATGFGWKAGGSSFDLLLNAVYMTRFDNRLVSTAPDQHVLNTVFNVPRFRARAGFSWRNRGWSASGFVNYLNSMTDKRFTPSRHISAFSPVDLTLSYELPGQGWGKGLQISATVLNLFNEDPPRVSPQAGTTRSIGYDPANATGLGRTVSIQIRKQW
jgi:outer membrane receptor protein involved in Fe transport